MILFSINSKINIDTLMSKLDEFNINLNIKAPIIELKKLILNTIYNKKNNR